MSEVTYRIGQSGPLVVLAASLGADTLHGLMPPAQARELAAALADMADIVQSREGLPGEAHRAAHVSLPAIEYTLPAMPLGS